MLNDQHARDPQRSLVHNTVAEAGNFIGALGQHTYTIDTAAGVIEERFHDGKTVGGFPTSIAAIQAPPVPFSRVVNIEGATIPALAEPEFVIIHDLGYNPLVQVILSTGVAATGAEYTVTYTDENTVAIKSVDATAMVGVTILLR